MAKVKSAYLNEIRGTVAKRLTFRKQKLKADQTLQKIPVPSYTRTTAQDMVRKGYRRLCDIWKTADWLNKEVYANFAKKYEITTFNSFLKYNMPVMSRKPVLYLSLDEGQGTTAHDFSEYQNNGTVYGATWQKLKNGKNVLYFDGVDDWIEIPHSTSLDTQTVTMCVWIYIPPYDFEGCAPIINRNANTNVWEKIPWQLRYCDWGGFSLIIGDGSTAQAIGFRQWEYNKWYFVAGVVTGSELLGYVNGNLKNSVTQNITPYTTTAPLGIARAGERYDKMVVAAVYIYNKALTEKEIKKIYETTKELFE
ncbi:MAG: hypothetical protein DRN30_01120 [Thermoplasmata archaeon]|nr:MAG: hypothetical protein DRN30_01120 [Thermoplasmata archaeon]